MTKNKEVMEVGGGGGGVKRGSVVHGVFIFMNGLMR